MRHAVLVLGLLLFSLVAAEDGAQYLVICHDSHLSAMQPLVEWRHATGMPAKLVPLSVTGSDSASVRNYIVDAWNNWPVRPDYVLIAASPAQLLARRYGDRWPYYSDNYYADVSGDHKAELAVGRFPAGSSSECELMVAKTLAYEHHPDLTDPDWMRRLTTVVREDYDQDDSIYWSDARVLAGVAGGAGFVSCDSLSRQRGHSYIDIRNSVDAGTGIVLYRGVAGGFWRDPFNFYPYTLSNTNLLPVIASITCETMSLNAYDELLGQQWIKAGSLSDLMGAVAFFGNTHSDVDCARERSAVTRGFAAGLFTDNQYRLGLAMLMAKYRLYEEYPAAVGDYRGFSIFGDPALPIWTATPKMLDVSQPLEILLGPQQLEITVEHLGAPVANAVVCASMDSTVYAVDTTGASGTVQLQVAPVDTGEMRLVVTGQNLYPHDSVIFVVTQLGAAEPRTPVSQEPSAFTASPSMFRCATTFNWPVRLGAASVVVRDANGRRVAELDPHATGSAVWNGAGIRAGVYFAALVTGDGRSLACTRVTKLR